MGRDAAMGPRGDRPGTPGPHRCAQGRAVRMGRGDVDGTVRARAREAASEPPDQRSRAVVQLSSVAKATARSTARRTVARHEDAAGRGFEAGENMCS